MRGDDRQPDARFSYIRPEQRVPADHPLRPIRDMVDTVLRELSPEFARLYPKAGRPSIPPEKLLRALLLLQLYSVRSERQLMEVGEQHGDLLALAFEGSARGEDLLGEVLGGVRLRGRRTNRGRRASGDSLAALEAEAGARR